MASICSEGKISRSVKSFERFEWTIHDFLKRIVDTRIESPGFPFSEASWHLALSSDASNISLTVWKTQNLGARHKVRIGVKRRDGTDGMFAGGETDTGGFLEIRKFLSWSVIADHKPKLFPNKSLTLFCEMSRERIGELASDQTDTSTDLLVQNLKDLFLDGQHSDVVLKVENKELKAHKSILGARCPAFAKMFQHDMAENNSGVVDILDCSADAFKSFLLYLYTGEVHECTSAIVYHLYYVSDKYGIQHLKEYCIKFMKNSLTVDTFCDVVTLALRHNESVLLEVATRFFSKNVKIIIKTVQWQRFLKDNHIQANELYIKALDA